MYATDDRRSAAKQFFVDEGASADANREIISLINESILINGINEKLDKLSKIQELILSRGHVFLTKFLPDMLSFQNDRNAEIRRFVVSFIEEAFKKQPEILPQIIGNIHALVQDTAPRVQKRVVQCVTVLYRHALMWLSKAQTVTDEMQLVWSILVNIKAFIINMVDSDNDGLRTQIVKFLETIVLLQTYREPDSTNRINDFSLEEVPLTLKIARRRKLEEEAMTVFDLMLKFHASPHISSANLMACMGSLTSIAKLRPNFMGKVITALEALHIKTRSGITTSPASSDSEVTCYDSYYQNNKLFTGNDESDSTSVLECEVITRGKGEGSLTHGNLGIMGAKSESNSDGAAVVTEVNNIDTVASAAVGLVGTINSDTSASKVGGEKLNFSLDMAAGARNNSSSLILDSNGDSETGNYQYMSPNRGTDIVNLPPTLSTSQVNSVRKHLKLNLLSLLKHPSAAEYQMNITTLLTDLGATTHEVLKAYPKLEETKKRSRPHKHHHHHHHSKKARLEEEIDDRTNDDGVDITETFIVERLSPELAANMVIVAMNQLPDSMPTIFSSTYTPIAAAGTPAQIQHVSRLLATQLNNAGLGPGATIAKSQKHVLRTVDEDDDDENGIANSAQPEEPVVAEEESSINSLKGTVAFQALQSRTFKQEMYKPMSKETRENLQVSAINRILTSEESAITGGVSRIRAKIVASIAASYGARVKESVLKFIMNDIRNQVNLSLAWIYEEYSYMQGFTKRPPSQMEENKFYDLQYGTLITRIINGIIRNKDLKDRDLILTRIILELPLLTDEVLNLIKSFSTVEVLGLAIVYKLVLMRPMKQVYFLNILLENSSHQTAEIRETSIGHIVDLYPKEELQAVIEEYAVYYLGFLKLSKPPDLLFGLHKGRPLASDLWTDDSIKACLYLYLSLLPIKQDLIHELARVYIQTQADIKRTILRVVEYPVRDMGMDSPQLLKLVEECPKGSETLVTRIIHILTDKSPPSSELVDRVRNLYQTRVPDVRFLIPVLNGLRKAEILEALPKLIKLNPVVVKEVFNRLLGTHSEAAGHSSPITPSELLIQLHLIYPTQCELKTTIKATSLCFSDKEAYTQEVLAVVLQHLMDITPIPTLLMRTVIQALSLYPRLIGFVMNILQRLISKQVWKQKKVWEGFIKCCQRTQPASFQVLLQLPPQQLVDVFKDAPDLRAPLMNHIMEFTENQRAHIPNSIMEIIQGEEEKTSMDYQIKEEPMSPGSELTIDIKEEPPDSYHASSEPAPPGLD